MTKKDWLIAKIRSTMYGDEIYDLLNYVLSSKKKDKEVIKRDFNLWLQEPVSEVERAECEKDIAFGDNSKIRLFMRDRYLDPDIFKSTLQYSAGQVWESDGRMLVGYEMFGAHPAFSIGQPVYDKDHNLMGYLGVGLLENLNFSGDIAIPVHTWEICLPTEHCEEGKRVYTFWQDIWASRTQSFEELYKVEK